MRQHHQLDLGEPGRKAFEERALAGPLKDRRQAAACTTLTGVAPQPK